MQAEKALVSLHINKACQSPHCLTLFMGTSTKSIVLAFFIYSLLLVILIMFPCDLFSTKANIKQNYTVKLSLIERNNSNKKSQCTVKVISFSHV